MPKKRLNYAVDIITPVYGGPTFLKLLAESLLETYDAGVEFKWIIIDDATPEERNKAELKVLMDELNAKYRNVVTIHSTVNGGYSKSNNIAVERGSAPNILLLNSDTIITHDNWLKTMVSTIESAEYGNPVAVVGAKLLYFENSNDPKRPAGKTQHAGVGFNHHFNPYHIFMGWDPDHPKVNEKRRMNAVTGACLLTTRRVYKWMNGLAEVYTKGNFEDVEYCIRLASRGYVIVYDPNVTLYHFGSGSDNTETAIRNNQIFKMRNKDILFWDDWRYF